MWMPNFCSLFRMDGSLRIQRKYGFEFFSYILNFGSNAIRLWFPRALSALWILLYRRRKLLYRPLALCPRFGYSYTAASNRPESSRRNWKMFGAKTYENSVFYKHYFNWVLTRISVLWILFFISPTYYLATKIKAIFSANFSKFSPRFLLIYRILKYFEKRHV